MISYEEQIELAKRSFEKLRGEGQEWVTYDELAFQCMLDHPDYERRRRAVNFLRGIFRMGESGEPTKVSSTYRHQTGLGVLGLQDKGEVEFRFLDQNGELSETPPEGKKNFNDRRYRLVSEETGSTEAVNAAASH